MVGEDIPGPIPARSSSIGTHDLQSVFLNGSGSAAIDRVRGLTFVLEARGSAAAGIADVAADQLELTLAGSTAIKLAGHARRLTASLQGLATLDAAKLETPQAHILAIGPSTVDATVRDSATVDASGPAVVRFAGSPSCELSLNGSATVTGCK